MQKKEKFENKKSHNKTINCTETKEEKFVEIFYEEHLTTIIKLYMGAEAIKYYLLD